MEKYDDVDVYQLSTEEIDPSKYFRVIKLPAIDRGFAFSHKGFAHRLYTTGNMERLDYIHQYGWFHGAPTHSRMNHQLLAYAFAHLIGNYLHLSAEKRRNLQCAALTHDVTTGAMGDRVKHIAQSELNEETTYTHWISDRRILAFFRKENINAQSCSDAIRGKDQIGKLLDWLDKIAYTYYDYDQLKQHHPEIYEKLRRRLQDYIRKFNTPLINTLRVDDVLTRGHRLHISLVKDHLGDTACGDIPVFVCFALMRAVLFEEVCFSGGTNAMAEFYGCVVAPYLITNNLLTVSDLRYKQDKDIAQVMADFFAVTQITMEREYFKGEWFFDTEAKAQQKAITEMKAPDVLAFIMKTSDYGKTCVSMVLRLGVFSNGHIHGLRDNELRTPFIRKAEEDGVKKFRVISIQGLPYNQEKINKLREFLTK